MLYHTNHTSIKYYRRFWLLLFLISLLKGHQGRMYKLVVVNGKLRSRFTCDKGFEWGLGNETTKLSLEIIRSWFVFNNNIILQQRNVQNVWSVEPSIVYHTSTKYYRRFFFFFLYLLKGHQGRIYKLLIVHFGYSSTFNQKNSQIFTTKREILASSMSNALHWG